MGTIGGCDARQCCIERPCGRKVLTPDVRRRAAQDVMDQHGLSERRERELANVHRFVIQYEKQDGGDEAL